MGRLTRDPEIRYSQSNNSMAIARYTLAVDRRFKHDGEQNADFISCVCFGKSAEFVEKYFRQGMKVTISGRIQTGSYTDKDGIKRYTTDIFVEEQEFAESKKANAGNSNNGNSGTSNNSTEAYPPGATPGPDGFMNIPDGIDEELPF